MTGSVANSVLPIWPFVLAALILVFAMLFIFLSGRVRSSMKTASAEDAGEESAEQHTAGTTGKPKTVGGMGLSASFSRALKLLKISSAGRDYRYEIPWFMVTGNENSGKAALLDIGGADRLGSSSQESLEWRLFDLGVLLGVPDPDTWSIQNENNWKIRISGTDDGSWSTVLKLLLKHRPRRPLDGIVLTLSAKEFISQPGEANNRLLAKAARIGERFALAQKVLGFTFPIYVVVTHCDSIPGFQGMFQELPSKNQQDIFGWSNPYQLESAFTSEWIDEAFDVFHGDLQRIQREIFVEKSDIALPDDVFLFPSEFAKLRTPVRLFLERLFRETVYRESLRFRGLYFSGDLRENVPALRPRAALANADVTPGDTSLIPFREQQASMSPPAGMQDELREDRGIPATFSASAPAQTVTSLFVRDLLEKKVFPECGVARPLTGVTLSRNKKVLAIQGFALGLLLFLTIVTLWSSRRLYKESKMLDGMFAEIDSQQIKQKQDGQSNTDPSKLLKAMATAGSVDFRSLALPTSFAYSTDANIEKVMLLSIDQLILDGLKHGLEAKVRDLSKSVDLSASTDGSTANADVDDRDAMGNKRQILDLEQLPAFKALDKFVSSLNVFQENAATYALLADQGGVTDARVRKLVAYLYKDEIDEIKANGHFHNALQHGRGQPLKPDSQAETSVETIYSALLDRTYNAWFAENTILNDLRDLQTSIKQLQRKDPAVGPNDLRLVFNKLKEIDTRLKSTGMAWLAKTKLDMNGPMGRVIQALRVSNNMLIGSEVLDHAQQNGDNQLDDLQHQLLSLTTDITGSLIDIDYGRSRVQISKEAGDLEILIENTLALSFIGDPGLVRDDRTLDPNLQVIWQTDPLDQAIDLYAHYRQYQERPNTTPLLKNTFDQIVRKRFEPNIGDLIKQARDIGPRPLAARVEDRVKDERAAYDAAFPRLEALSGDLAAGKLTTSRSNLITFRRLQALNVLSLLDEELTKWNPYGIIDTVFSTWDGTSNLAQTAFHVQSAEDLKTLLAQKQARLHTLSQLSDPFVAFLKANPSGLTSDNLNLRNRWESISTDLKDYEDKNRTGSLGALTDYIVKDMSNIKVADACKVSAGASAAEGDDYFDTERATYVKAASLRCQGLLKDRGFASYLEIKDAFNANLAGKFPFAAITNQGIANEVTPKALKDFYAVFSEQRSAAEAFLGKYSERSSQEALRFLHEMDRWQPLLVPAPTDADKDPLPQFFFTPTFRTQRITEQGANQIIDWTLQAGSQIFQIADPEHAGLWRYGNQVRLVLRWANDSQMLPAQGLQPNIRLMGERSVFIEFKNKWALLAMLRQQQVRPTDSEKLEDAEPYTLRFRIKSIFDPQWSAQGSRQPPDTVVYLHVKVYLSDPKKPIEIPAFHASAPELSTGITK